MSRHSILVGFAVLLAGCAMTSPRRRSGTTPYARAQNAQPPSGGGTNNTTNGVTARDPREHMGEVDEHLQAHGYARLGPVVHNRHMPPNGLVGYAVHSRPGMCYAVVAVADAGADLNVVVVDPYGRTAAHNVQPDSHPWATFCSRMGGRYSIRLQMARGAGQYYYGTYQGAAGASPELAAFFGAAQQDPATTMEPATEQRLEALDEQLAAERFERVGSPQGVTLQAREARLFQLPYLQQGYCYAFATLGGPGAQDTDAIIVDGTGEELARDSASTPDSIIRFCPSQSGSYGLKARMYEGSGPVFAVGYVRSEQRTASADEEAPQGDVIGSEASADTGLDDNYRLVDADLHARGYKAFGEPSRGELSDKETRRFDIELEGGKCYALLAVGDSNVRDLNLTLLSPAGEKIDQDSEKNARPVVRVCPDASGQYAMEVAMVEGEGEFIYAPYRWPRGTRGPFGLAGLMYVRLAEVTSLLGVEGYEPDANYAPGRGALKRRGRAETESVGLKGGACYAVLVVGGEGIHDLDVTLLKSGKTIASDSSSHAFPSLRVCPDRSSRLALKIASNSGRGKYFYQVFRRKEIE